MQPIPETSPQFSNLQLELLRLYARNTSDEELRDIKKLLANYFAERLSHRADEVWQEKGWTDETMEEFLQTKMRRRTSSQPE